MNRIGSFFSVIVLAATGLAVEPQPAGNSNAASNLVFVLEPGPRQHFEVRGLTTEQADRLTAFQTTGREWPQLFTVAIKPAGDVLLRPMLGTYAVAEGRLRFEPRFPLEPGRVYVAEFRPGRLDGESSSVIRREFRLPEAPAGEATRLVEVYPTRSRLPANLLKVYLHFSAPMSRGDSYRHLHLLDAAGQEIDAPFLEIGEELWNEAGTRLTVLFDPGRVKQELKPRREAGPVLEDGKAYSLVIDADWPDATGRPLTRGLRRTFHVGPPDDRQPDPRRWTLTPPASGTRVPVLFQCDEPLDHALLERVLSVQSSTGKPIPGHVQIDREETRWQFFPARPWETGAYGVRIEATLEDLAGNSIGRPFEVDLMTPIERSSSERSVSVPFDVTPATSKPLPGATK